MMKSCVELRELYGKFRHSQQWLTLLCSLLCSLLMTGCLLWLTADRAQAQSVIWHRISHEVAAAEDVVDIAASLDQQYAVYISGFSNNPFGDIYSVPIQGGTPVRLNEPPAGPPLVFEFEISPDSQWIVYIGSQDPGGVYELYSVPIDGSAPPVKLNGPMAGRGVQPTFATNNARGILKFTPDSNHVIYVADQEELGVNELYNAPIDGSAAPIKLSNVGHINGLAPSGLSFNLTPDGSRVIYIAAQNLPGVFELFSAPTAGNAAAFRLNGPMVAGGNVAARFQISPDGTRVTYIADQDTGNVFELYSVPANGGIVKKLNFPLPNGARVLTAEITPDSRTVLFRILEDSRFQLWRAPIDGTTAAVQLSDLNVFAVSRDGAHVVYAVADGEEKVQINRFDLNSGRTTVIVPPTADAISAIVFSTDNRRMAYIAQPSEDLREVFSVLVDGSAPPVKLSEGLSDVAGFFLFVVGENVLFFDRPFSRSNLIQVPVDGSRPPIQINAPLSDVLSGVVSPDGQRILYRSDQVTEGVFELFSAFDAPEVAFTNGGFIVTEDGSGDNTIAVERFGINDAPGSIRVAFEDETATGGATLGAGVDYENNALTILFGAGQVTATVPVPIHDDGVAEAVEFFSMQLFEPDKVLLTSPDQARVSTKDTNATPILSDSSFNIQENSPNGTVGGTLDTGGQEGLTFSIQSGNTNNAFRMEGSNVVVNNSSAIDFESISTFLLTVEASVGGALDVAQVSVKVINVNEPPTAEDAGISILENTPSGTKIGTILARDPDSNDALRFTTSSRVFFADSATGTLFVRDGSALDFATQSVHTFTVDVTDSGNLKATTTVKVQLIEVVKDPPAAIRITSLSPTSAVAGGRSFWLRLEGKNFTRNSRVRWNGSQRSTFFSSSSRIYGYISSTDIAKTGTFVIDVVDGTQKSQDQFKFLVYFGKVGISELAFETPGNVARSLIGLTTTFTLNWTHTTLTWREMDVMDLRIRDDERIALWVRYTEALVDGADASTLLLLNEDGTPAGSGRFGENKILENDMVLLDLSQSGFVGSGPTGSSVSVRIPVVFKEGAEDRLYNIELFAVDDQEDKQGPDIAGTWEIIRPTMYLPFLSQE